MSRNHRHMPDGVLTTARNIFACVPHVEFLSARWMRDVGIPGGPVRSIRFTVNAWGPTLHRRMLHWTTRLDPGPNPGIATPDITDDEAVGLAAALEAYVPTQAALAAWAAAEGIDEPMDAPAGASFGDVCHLHIDRRLADLMIANRGAQGAVVRILDLLECMTDELSDDLQAGASFEDGVTTLWMDEILGTRCRLDGDAVQIDADLPDTLIDAAVGRRLGDVVATGIASIDDAIITEAGPGSFADVRFGIAPDRIRIADHPVLRAAIPGG
jgi:hypothetical protein